MSKKKEQLGYLEMLADRKCVCESGKEIKPGDKVRYCGHVVGGMVRVEFPDGTKDIAHPGAFPSLR